MAEGGWIKVYCKMIDDPAFFNSTPAQYKVLMTVLFLASWTERKWDVLGHEFTLHPGEVFISSIELAERAGAGITRQVVRKAIVRFEKLGFWTIKRTKRGMLISIVNWGKYQGSQLRENHIEDQSGTNAEPKENQSGTNAEPKENQSGTNVEPTNKEDSKKVRIEEGKKGAPPSLLKILDSFETHHQTPELTSALVEWAEMRKSNGKPVNDKDLSELLRQLMEISGGNIARAIAIVRQSTDRKWNRFWELKQPPASFQPVRYPKPPRELPKGIPPPKPEDFPGDPVGFQEAMNGWALLHGEENKAIKHRLGEPDEAEKEKILLSMAGQDPTGGT